MSYENFLASEQRWLLSLKEVSFIDSVYRNRDAKEAKRGLGAFDKWWKDDEELGRVILGGGGGGGGG